MVLSTQVKIGGSMSGRPRILSKTMVFHMNFGLIFFFFATPFGTPFVHEALYT